MRIESLQPSSSTGQAAPAPPQQEFLRLLVAQLEHQNPLDPQDGAAFVAQLAQFASLEQAAETNQRLEGLQAEQASSTRAALTALVGRPIVARADQVTIAQGEAPPLSVHLEGSASEVQVTLVDEAGNPVRTVELGAHAPGDVAIDWGAAGPPPPGSYTIQVSAKGTDGNAVEAHAQIIGTIDSVEFLGGVARFHVGSAIISPADIESVSN